MRLKRNFCFKSKEKSDSAYLLMVSFEKCIDHDKSILAF